MLALSAGVCSKPSLAELAGAYTMWCDALSAFTKDSDEGKLEDNFTIIREKIVKLAMTT
jgi:hypothetical protein